MAKGKAVIVGGSLGGLLAANMLHRAGWDVSVHERVVEELEGRGAGIVTHPELLQGLRRAGIGADATVGIDINERITLGPDGSIVGRVPLRQTMTGWSRLYRLLRDALPTDRYHRGMALESVELANDSVTAAFAGGVRIEGDLLVAADGIRSTVRKLLQPEAKPVYAGYIAWRGLVEESELTPAVRDLLFERFGFCLPPREQMLGYPVAGANNSLRPGERRYNLVWYRPADEREALPRLLTADDGRYFPEGIPPHLISQEVIAEMRHAAETLLAPQFREMVRLVRQPFFQPINDLATPRLAMGRVVLVGDAAFVARPHCGMGVTKAASDAVVLVDALEREGDIDRALAIYNSERVSFGNAIVDHARRLGAYMQAQLKSDYERQMAELYRTPEAVMAETAVPPAAL